MVADKGREFQRHVENGIVYNGADFSNPLLSSISGYTQINAVLNWASSTITWISLPILANVKNIGISNNANLLYVSMPVLTCTQSEQSFNIYSNPALTVLNFPSLATVGWYFYIGGNSALTYASFPVLTYAGSFFQVTACSPVLQTFIFSSVFASSASVCGHVTVASGLLC